MITYTTFQDVIDHGFDYLGGNPSDQVKRDIVRAAIDAYRDIANCFNWSYLYTHGRIYTNGAFDGSRAGATIQYQGSGAQYPRQRRKRGRAWVAPGGVGSGSSGRPDPMARDGTGRGVGSIMKTDRQACKRVTTSSAPS